MESAPSWRELFEQVRNGDRVQTHSFRAILAWDLDTPALQASYCLLFLLRQQGSSVSNAELLEQNFWEGEVPFPGLIFLEPD